MTTFQKQYFIIALVILLEFISPVPLFLSFGAVFILLVRPRWFLRFVRKLYTVQQEEEIERLIIGCARAHQNRLTVTELAAETSLNLKEAEVWLHRLEIEGRITSMVNDLGTIVFDFNELLPAIQQEEPTQQHEHDQGQ
jgi:hypothetical protein